MKYTAVVAMALLSCSASQIDMGPTYGKDYAGRDYNVTIWHSPSSASANHYGSQAKACQAYCDKDPKCCAWTYCPPDSGVDEKGLGERCCLKGSVPAEKDPSPHWTGLAARAVADGKISAQCDHPGPAPGPAPGPYPGPDYQHPKIHNSPECLHIRGWHDVAGALSYKGEHHVFQGCPESGGWHHGALC